MKNRQKELKFKQGCRNWGGFKIMVNNMKGNKDLFHDPE